MSRSIVLLLSLGLVACDKSEPTDTGATDPGVDTTDQHGDSDDPVPEAVDADGDGFTEDEDCDDTDASVNPGAAEACDGIDNDCDGTVDAGADDAETWYFDGDGDGYGDPETTTETCDAKEPDYVLDASDCDDADAAVHPEAEEVCDGIDNNCSGAADPDDAVDASTWYRDEDGDGYGSAEKYLTSCDQPSDFVADASDCDDEASEVSPDATEVCDGIDNDCSGVIDGGDAADAATWFADGDGDGFGDADASVMACEAPSGFVSDASDCDDGMGAVHPEAIEICDGIDNDCSGDADSDATDMGTFYADADGDGFGDPASSMTSCIADVGYVEDATDCDDGASGVNTAATEVCDGIDNDCSGDADSDATDMTTWYEDADRDGYAGATSVEACTAPADHYASSDDCDDERPGVNPGAEEVCDGIDNDCSGDADSDATDQRTWYADSDGDGFGDPTSSQESCSQPSGYLVDDSDCDDSAAGVRPGAEEVCDGIDNDCSGDADSDATDRSTWYADTDGDGFGDAATTSLSCEAPSGYIGSAGDCDDEASAVHPDATEVCDGIDNDCSGDADSDATDLGTWYADADGDGFGDDAVSSDGCEAPSGYVSAAGDCDDASGFVHPDAAETCDGVDSNCSGDEADAADASTWYADADGDGYGDLDTTTVSCAAPSGYLADASDCDDSSSSVSPGASETCDGVDSNCSGDESDALDISTWYADMDADGYGDFASTMDSCTQPSGFLADASDCDDAAIDVNPGAVESCDGTDNNCSGDEDDAYDVATYYADFDSDGYGDVGSSVDSCTMPSGYVSDFSDCDDDLGDVNPAAEEICSDGLDNDCDGGAGACIMEGDYDLGSVDVKLTGVGAYDYTGRSVAGAGDLDGDGYDDILVSAHKYDDPSIGGDAGAAHIMYGPISSGSTSLAEADARLIGEVASDVSSYAVNSAGDVDGDGFDDVIVGTYAHDGAGSNAGGAWLVHGPITGELGLADADAIINGTNAGDGFGVAVSGAGDLNGDGYGDLIMGAYGYQGSKGATYVFFGPVSGEFKSDTADAGFVGGYASDSLGWSVAPAGDVDGDGYDDIVFGSNKGGPDDEGEVFVYYGDPSGSFGDYAFISGAAANDFAGQDVRGAGDLNGDGYDDIVIGAYGEDTVGGGAGASYVLYGPVVGDIDLAAGGYDAVIYGESGGDTSGYSVAGVGDVNGDGWDDLMIGAYNNDQGGSNAGAAYLLYGPVEGEISLSDADARFLGESNGDSAGRYVAGAGDVNADGYADMLVGAQYDDDGGTDAGAAYLIYGRGL